MPSARSCLTGQFFSSSSSHHFLFRSMTWQAGGDVENGARAVVALREELREIGLGIVHVAGPEYDFRRRLFARRAHHVLVAAHVAIDMEEEEVGVEGTDFALEAVAEGARLVAADGEVAPDELHRGVFGLEVLHHEAAPELPDDRLPVEEDADRGGLFRRRVGELFHGALDEL